MKLTTFTSQCFTRVGIVTEDVIVDLSQAAPDLPLDMVGFLEGGEDAMERARSAATRTSANIALKDVRFEAPVLRPRKFLGVGANYPGKQFQKATRPVWFNKQVTCVNGPYDPIELPRVSEQLIYEVELAFVIGQRCRHVAKEDASKVIAGYVICNDVTVVDWVLHSPTVILGKSFDTHGPIGPWIVTGDEIGNPHALGLRAFVNGVEMQAGNTSKMLCDCFELVAYVSQVFTLEPGDLVTTGSPTRVTEFLKTGDVVRCEIEGIGHIENVVVPERRGQELRPMANICSGRADG